MIHQQNHLLSARTKSTVQLLASLSILIGITGLCGWLFNINLFKSIIPGTVSMKANTAVCVMLGSLGLFLQTPQTNINIVLWLRRGSFTFLCLIGLMTLCEYGFGWDAGIDQLLFRASAHEVLTPFPGRMSLISAGCFTVLGIAFLLIELKRGWTLIQMLALLGFSITFLPLAGYMYGDIAFPHINGTSHIAIHTAVAVMMLNVGIFILTAQKGIIKRLEKKLSIVSVSVALALFLVIAGGMVHSIKQNIRAADSVEHSYKVVLHIESTSSNLNKYRATVGSFLISENKKYYSQLTQARQQILAEIGTVKQLTADNRVQQQGLKDLSLLLAQRFNVCDERMIIRHAQGLDGLLKSGTSEQVDRLNDEVMRKLEEMKAIELSLLRHRQQDAGFKNQMLIVTVIFFMAVVFILIVVAIRFLLTEILQHSESEARLESLFNTSAIAIVVINEQGVIEEFNSASEVVFGYGKGDVLGQNIKLLMPEPYHSEHDRNLQHYLSTGQKKVIGFNREIMGKHKDGSIFPMELNVGEVLLSERRVFIGFVKDISERKQMEKDLITARQNESNNQHIKRILDNLFSYVALLDTDAVIQEVNQAPLLQGGFLREDVIGKYFYDAPWWNYDDKVKDQLIEAIEAAKQGKISRYDVFVKMKDQLMPIDFQISPVHDEKGNIIGLLPTGVEIIERKKMELASRQFEAIVQSSDDAIISKALDGIVTSWNPGAESMFGYTAEEMIGKTMTRLFPADRTNEERQILDQIANGRRVDHFETLRLRKDGTVIDVSVSLSPIFDETGTVIGAAKIARDISQSKQLEKDLITARQIAEVANRSKSEFLANMSHEIRTPMNAILGLTRLALESELPPKQQDYLTKIQTASQALLTILNDILDLSKIESGRLELEQIEFNPTLMLQNVIHLFVAKVEEKKLNIFLEVAPETPLTIVGDPLRIQQVLSNLISNAIKFTPKGEITIRVEPESSSGNQLVLRFNVRDTGIGINKNAIDKLFQSFSQADSSITRKFGGTGLGLVISKQLIHLMGGDISVISELGQGSTFSFTVCCTKGQSYNWQEDTHSIRHLKVLVIDDQETSCTILKSVLESWGLQVETTTSGEVGLEKISAAEHSDAPFNLLLLDWKLDGINGLQLAQHLKQKESRGDLKYFPTIIMVTAYNKEQLLEEMTSTSFYLDTILTKPVVPSTLLNTILHVYGYQAGETCQVSQTPANPYELAKPLRNMRVLLVEDNALNQQVAGEFLEKAGLQVSIANHGGEAVQWLQQMDFDVVLMDLQMPEMDGYEATRRIRQLPKGQDFPIIAMTAAAMRDDRDACLAAGMNDHIAKPIQPLELIKILLRWTKLPDSKQQESLKADTVDTTSELTKNLAKILPGFDLQNIMIMLAHNEERLIQVLNDWREKSIREIPIIASHISVGEFKAAEPYLHSLKGTAGNLGAKQLYQISAELDIQLIKGKYEAETFVNWQQTFHETMDSIAALTLQFQSASIIPPTENKTVAQVLAELDTLLANDSFIDNELLMQLKKRLPETQKTEFEVLNQLIIDTDYVKARAIINTLCWR